jgi:hypothetical protein
MLLNPETITDLMTEATWSESHHAKGDFLGVGLLYYTLAYLTRAELCVCLGSGGGFTPRLMRQAQRDVNPTGRTVLVDGFIPDGGWGVPTWGEPDSYFRVNYPDLEIWQCRTSEAIGRFHDRSIDLLHVDADHSYEGVKADVEGYTAKVRGYLTLHDTEPRGIINLGVPQYLRELRATGQWDVLEFPFAAGTALLRRR